MNQIKKDISEKLAFQKQIAAQDKENKKVQLFVELLEEADLQIDNWIKSLENLIDLAKHTDTTGGRVASEFLCSIYNGGRVPFDTRSLCSLDMSYWSDAINVLKMDRLNIQEIHYYIDNGSEIFKNILKKKKFS